MKHINLNQKPLHQVYYLQNNILYKISQSIDDDNCDKMISVTSSELETYTQKNNEIAFIPDVIDVSCKKDTSILWHSSYYLETLIEPGDSSYNNGKGFKPNSEHHKFNASTNSPENYIQLLTDFYKTNIVNDYLNGVSIEGIYDSLPIFYKNRDRFDKTKIYEITCKSADVNTTTDLSIGLVVLEKNGVLDISILNSLRTNIEDAIKEKYTQLMNKELNKIGKQVNAITTKKL